MMESLFYASRSGEIAQPNFISSFLNYLFGPKKPGNEFDKFMDFLKKQGVERKNQNESFKFEKIADNWNDLPSSIRNYEPSSSTGVYGYGDMVDDLGSHPKNQRLPEGYHLSVENDGKVYVHHDFYDPLNGYGETAGHIVLEYIPKLDQKPQPGDNRHPDWSNN
jgi:hypothetical protein